jgi:hypothetical protein
MSAVLLVYSRLVWDVDASVFAPRWTAVVLFPRAKWSVPFAI